MQQGKGINYIDIHTIRSSPKVGDACYPGVCGTGKCEDTPSGIQCHCPIGRTGERCRLEKTVKEPAFTGESYVAYPRPKHLLRRLNLAFKFKAKETKDSVLFYCAQADDGHGEGKSVARGENQKKVEGG